MNSGYDEWAEIEPTAQHINEATQEIEVVMEWGKHPDATFDDVSEIFYEKIFLGEAWDNHCPEDFFWQMEAVAYDEGPCEIWVLERSPEVAQAITDACQAYIKSRSLEIAIEDAESGDWE